MNLIWNKSLETGIVWQDTQHKELLQVLSNLYSSMNNGFSRQTLNDSLDFLKRYVYTHFYAEERAMELHNYVEYEAHRSEHLSFVHDLNQLIEKSKTNSLERALIPLQQRLLRWFLEHIAGTDKKLAEFLRGRSNDF